MRGTPETRYEIRLPPDQCKPRAWSARLGNRPGARRPRSGRRSGGGFQGGSSPRSRWWVSSPP